ncbi:MAG: flagellar hook-length control protein FliK [Lachnospiraceae bacterium]|nr:flagellar hook-length control protein FliK [Lachnospiraceae bacterium]
MALNLDALNAYRQTSNLNSGNVNYNSGVESNLAGRNSNLSANANITPGQVVGGEVINVKNNEITLKLDNNSTLTAQLDQNMDISTGQKLVFQVTGNGERMTLHPLYNNLANNSMANAALFEAGLKSTATNLAMVTGMLEEGMSVNKQALQAMARNIESNPTTDPATIIQLTKLGLQVNELNIEQYENYMNFEHQIINDAEGLSSGLSNLIGSNPGVEGVIQSNEGITNTDSGASAILNNAQLQLSNDILSLVNSGDKNWNEILNNPQITATASQSIEIGLNGPGIIITEVTDNMEVNVEDVWAVTLNPDSQNESAMNTSVNMGETAVNQEGGTALSQGQSSDDNSQLMKGLMEDLSKLGMPAEELNNIANGTMNSNDIIDFVKTLINNNNNGYKLSNEQMEALTKLLNNGDFKQLVGNQLMKQMLLNPVDVAKDGAVEELYKRLAEQSSRAMEILKDANLSGTEVAKSAQNINDNVNFMNQINQMAQYVQLPIRMQQENAHGELFVYTKKKNLSNKDGNISALLHLDMDNLGPMDVYVAMQKNKVSTNFYLADEAALNLVEDNISILDARLLKKGYNMSTSVTMKKSNEEPVSVVGELLKEKSNGVVGGPIVSKLSFDVRA